MNKVKNLSLVLATLGALSAPFIAKAWPQLPMTITNKIMENGQLAIVNNVHIEHTNQTNASYNMNYPQWGGFADQTSINTTTIFYNNYDPFGAIDHWKFVIQGNKHTYSLEHDCEVADGVKMTNSKATGTQLDITFTETGVDLKDQNGVYFCSRLLWDSIS